MMAPFRVIVAGSRDFDDYDLLKRKLDIFLLGRDRAGITILSGAARGADKLGERYANEHGYSIMRFPADWRSYGKAAGPIRNADMVSIAHALVAFWDGESRGTADVIAKARAKDLKVHVINTKGERSE